MILLRRFDGSDRQKSQLCQDAIVIMLWSRNLIFTDVILTLGWRPDARLFEWKLNFVYIDFHILCIHRLGGIRSSRWLESMLNLTVLGIVRDVDCAQSFMRSRVIWERSVEVALICPSYNIWPNVQILNPLDFLILLATRANSRS